MALISSGDAGIYGLAPLVFELLDSEARAEWRMIEVRVCPGVSALQAAAARAGAPLGNDFCAISLSDLLTPWEIIRARIEAAAAADLAVALFNPRSARRQRQLAEAAAILLQHRSPETPVFIGRNLGRDGEEHRMTRLCELCVADIDMLTIVLVGNSRTRLIDGTPPYLTPRAAISTSPGGDRPFHRRRPRCARPDHRSRTAADRALSGMSLRRLPRAARDSPGCTARRADHRYRASDARGNHGPYGGRP